MLFKDQECSDTIKIKVKPGIVAKAAEVYRANHPFAKRVDFDELFEQLITLAALQLGLITNTDLGISEGEFKQLVNSRAVEAQEFKSIPEIRNSVTVEEEVTGLDLLN
jgi:hypothetical protein